MELASPQSQELGNELGDMIHVYHRLPEFPTKTFLTMGVLKRAAAPNPTPFRQAGFPTEISQAAHRGGEDRRRDLCHRNFTVTGISL
jgi:hypothetical protein